MRKPITVRLDPAVLEAARGRAQSDNRTLAEYIESLVRKDLRIDEHAAELEVVAPADIRDSTAVPLPGETDEDRKRRDAVFAAVLDAGGY